VHQSLTILYSNINYPKILLARSIGPLTTVQYNIYIERSQK